MNHKGLFVILPIIAVLLGALPSITFAQSDNQPTCPSGYSLSSDQQSCTLNQQPDYPVVSALKNHACNIIAGAGGALVGGALGTLAIPGIGTVGGAHQGALAAQGLC